MKAIVYTEYGTPDVLQLKEVAKPVPRENELLIRVMAAEATKGDCELRSFHFSVKWFWLPLRLAMGMFKPKRRILGGYFSGEVVDVGEAVSRFKPGEQVFGCARLAMGAYGEYLCIPEDYTLAPKPQNISYAAAAAVPLGGLNALHFMRRAEIQPGEKILIIGAGGSIGSFAVQIAKAWGAKVTAVDSGIKEAMLRRLGIEEFIDYEKQDVFESAQTFDVIFNMVAKNSYSRSIKALKPGGRYLMGNPRVVDMLRSVITTRFTDKKVLFAFAAEKLDELLALKAMLEKHEISPLVDKIFPLAQAAEAHRRVENEQRLGPVVIAVSDSLDGIN